MPFGWKRRPDNVLRHRERTRRFEGAAGCSDTIDAVDAHLARHVGEVATVYHELVSDLVHVDVHLVPADDNRPFHTLMTSGMSDRPMAVPSALAGEVPDRAEVMIQLPPEWPVDQEAWVDERHYWPVRTLKILARLPHEYDTWLGAWHSLPHGEPPAPYADDTAFCGVMLAPPLRTAPEFTSFTTDDGREVQVLAVIPLLADELAVKVERGVEALFDGLDAHHVSELLDPRRPSVLDE